MVSKGMAGQETGITNGQGKPDVERPNGSIGTISTETIADSSAITLAERLESLKAGVAGALTTALVYALEMVANHGLSWRIPLFGRIPLGENGTEGPIGLSLLVSLGAAILAGFLFGVTYRYVIRRDRNSHLGDGAVLAFGLVRGLAQVEGRLPFSREILPAVVLVAESIVLFAIARLVLDAVLYQGWVKPFRSH